MKLASAILILLVGIYLQLVFGYVFGIWINFALAALVVSALFLEILEIIPMIFFSVFLLNWQPLPSWEFLILALAVLGTFKLRDFFPWQSWLSATVFIFSAVLVLYLFFGLKVVAYQPAIFAADIFASVLFGVLAFKTIGLVAL